MRELCNVYNKFMKFDLNEINKYFLIKVDIPCAVNCQKGEMPLNLSKPGLQTLELLLRRYKNLTKYIFNL